MNSIEFVARAICDDRNGGLWEELSERYRASYRAQATAAITALREPTHAITRAMAESHAMDDEGEFPILLDLLDFSGENKTHTVLAQAWRDGVDAILREG